MLILKARHLKVFFEKIYLSNIEHDVATSKIPFLSLLSREYMSRYFFLKIFSCMQGQYQDRQKCILKICNF